jgi:ElaB/YqjD/DUF883 family membrane-anchored ribosome-binding protein
MSEPILPVGVSDVPWSSSDYRARVPDTSMLPGSESAPPPMVKLMTDAVQGSHDAIDRLAERVAPVARQLGERASAAEGALQAKADRLRERGDEWVESLRRTVRRKPLSAVAVALAIGTLVSRITR